MMSLPRVVEVRDGHIYFRVHPQAEQCFMERPVGENRSAFERPIRLKTVLKEGDVLDIGGYRIYIENDALAADRSCVAGGAEDIRLINRTPRLFRDYRLDIFVDQNIVEIFVNEGEYVLSNIVYELGHEIKGLTEGSEIFDFKMG